MIHGRVFRTEEAGAIPAALAKGKGDVYIYAPAATVQRVHLETEDELATWIRHCDLVAIGRMNGGGSSYMTVAKGFLNTDWDFVIEEVLKDNTNWPETPGSAITVIRSGGKIAVDGRTVYAVRKMYREFESGGQYLMFL